MNNIRELEARLADERRAALHQRVLDLEKQHQEAVWKAGAARKEAEGLVTKFREQEAERELAHQAYLDSQSAIAALESDYEATDFPTKDETARYVAERHRLDSEMDEKRSVYVKLKQLLEPLRLEAVLADQQYIDLAATAQNIGNQLNEAREKESGTSNDPLAGPMLGFIPTQAAEKNSVRRTRMKGRGSLL
jgi:hypothetical protein